MFVCGLLYGALFIFWLLVKNRKIRHPPKGVFLVLFLSITVALGLFSLEKWGNKVTELERNSYGEGAKKEELEVQIYGEEGKESIQVEISEQEYTEKEIQEIFSEVMETLDKVILGKNESFDRIEYDLDLVTYLEDYPVMIEWELGSYDVLNIQGEIQEEELSEEGTLIDLRGTISYLDYQAFYQRTVRVYPRTLVGMELLLSEIKDAVGKAEEGSREQISFQLPEEVSGAKLSWHKRQTNTGYYILLMGIGISVFFIYRRREAEKSVISKRHNELIREYPGMISKVTMLLGTGMTLKNVWERIVQSYEKQTEQMGTQLVYEEMKITLHEIQGGIPEGEAYERFGRRCELVIYLKFGALLSQNLRKGSRGLSELLRVEAIQSFENRKSLAKKQGEEAGAKLMIPMMGMLAVVLILVIVPAFLTMQL